MSIVNVPINSQVNRQWLRRFRRLIQAIMILGIFIMAIAKISPENDIYWQLKIGESIIEDHHFPTTDPYNLSNPNAVWTLEEWLVEVLFYLLHKYFGWSALIILKAGIVALTFAILLKLLNRLKTNLYVSLLLVIFAALVNTRGYWTVFPSIFEYLFVVVALYLMEIYRSAGNRWIPWLIPIFSLIWANAHASFFLLEGITGAYIGGSLLVLLLRRRGLNSQPLDGILNWVQIKHLSLATVIALIVPLISPNTYNTWLYPFIISTAKFSTSYVNEYVSFPFYFANFGDGFLVPLVVCLFIICVVLFIVAKSKTNPIDIILFAIFSFLAYRAYRHIAIFGLVALPIACRYISLWFREYRGWLGRSLIKDSLIVIMILSFIFWYKTKNVPFGLGIDMSGFPVEAAEFVNENQIAPNMFNHYNYGGFLIWKMPGYQVFIDGRLEMYLGQAGEDYLKLLDAQPGWEQIIDKYKINFFLNFASSPITGVLLYSDDWRLVYFEDQYVVFVKNTPENAAVIAKHYRPEAVETYRRVYEAQLTQKNAEDYNQEGLAFVREKRYAEAVFAFERASELNPRNVIYFLNLANAYFDGRQLDQALVAYKAVLLLDPQNELAKKRAALLEGKRGYFL